MTAGGAFITLESSDALATAPAFELGTAVRVASTQEVFYCAGRTTREIANLLEWTQQNVWLPDHARDRMELRHPEFSDHLRAISMVLENPLSVREVPDEPDQIRFVASATELREANIIRSRTMEHVDVLIELRLAIHESYLRVFHLSPMRHPQIGQQRWP